MKGCDDSRWVCFFGTIGRVCGCGGVCGAGARVEDIWVFTRDCGDIFWGDAPFESRGVESEPIGQ